MLSPSPSPPLALAAPGNPEQLLPAVPTPDLGKGWGVATRRRHKPHVVSARRDLASCFGATGEKGTVGLVKVDDETLTAPGQTGRLPMLQAFAYACEPP